MRDHVLTAVLVTLMSSPASAAPGLLAEPASPGTVQSRADAAPAATAAPISDERTTYVAGFASVEPRYLGDATYLHAELGRQVGGDNVFIHLLAGTAVIDTSFPISVYEFRGGVELRSRASSIRGLAGLDVGAVFVSAFGESASALEVVPRIGVEVGDRVWFRGSIELPFLPEAVGEEGFEIPVMIGAGIGAEL